MQTILTISLNDEINNVFNPDLDIRSPAMNCYLKISNDLDKRHICGPVPLKTKDPETRVLVDDVSKLGGPFER